MIRFIFVLFGFLHMFDVSAQTGDRFEIKIGNAKLKGVLPGNRTGSAPDLNLPAEFDICSWLKDEDNHAHNAQTELVRKLWEFKRLFRAPSGSLKFTVSVVNSTQHDNNLRSYYQYLYEKSVEKFNDYVKRGYTDHNYTPAEGYEEFDIDGHQWMKYNADNKSSRYYRTYLDKHLILRINLIQSDNRKNAINGQWHPDAERLAKDIINSISLSVPDDGKLCGCWN